MKGSYRIALVTPWNVNSYGGTQTLLTAIADQFSALGHSVRLICGDTPAVQTTCREATVIPFKGKAGDSSQDCSLIGLEQQLTAFAPHVVLYSPHVTGVASQCAASCQELGAAFVYWPAVHLDQEWHTGPTAVEAYRRADLLVANSEAEFRWLKDSLRSGDPRCPAVELIGCGVHSWVERPKPRGMPVYPGPLRCCSVGQLRPKKGFTDQVVAVETLATQGWSVTLEIVGKDYGAGERILETGPRLAARGALRLRGELPDEEKEKVLRRSHFMLFTGQSESFGIAVLEAIAAGLPVVAYPDQPYSGIVLRSGFGCLARHQDPAALAKALINCTRRVPLDSARRLELLRASSWQSVAKRLIGAIRRLGQE